MQTGSSTYPSSSPKSSQKNQINKETIHAGRDSTKQALDNMENVEVKEKDGDSEGLYRWGQLESSTQRVGRLLPLQLAALYRATSSNSGAKKNKGKTKAGLFLDATVLEHGQQEGPQSKRQLEYSEEDVEGWRQLDAVFGVTDVYTPFAIFRRPAYTGGWAVKKLALRSTRCSHQLDLVLREVMSSLLVNGVVPYNTFHVEHCVDCKDHQNTTRHEPGSYERAFKDFRKEFKKKMPPSLIYGNNAKICLSSLPFRLGSFEVLFRPYDNTQSRFIYSKLQTEQFPDSNDLATELTPIMLPEVWKFSSESVAMLEVLAFDAGTKKPIGAAEVSVFLVCVSTYNVDDDLEGLEKIQKIEKGQEEEKVKEKEKIKERKATKEAERASIVDEGITSNSVNVGIRKRLSPSKVRPKSAGPIRKMSSFHPSFVSPSIHRDNSTRSTEKEETTYPSSIRRATLLTGLESAPSEDGDDDFDHPSPHAPLFSTFKRDPSFKKAATFKPSPSSLFPELKSDGKMVEAKEPSGPSFRGTTNTQFLMSNANSNANSSANLFAALSRKPSTVPVEKQPSPVIEEASFVGITPLKRPKSTGAFRFDEHRTMSASPNFTQAKLKQLAEASAMRQEKENQQLEAGRKKEKERGIILTL
jgi:hypothetical protein